MQKKGRNIKMSFSSYLILFIIGILLLSLSIGFYAVTFTMQKSNDQGELVEDSQAYMKEFLVEEQLRDVDPSSIIL